MNKKYIKFRVVEQNGLYSIQGLQILCPKLESVNWFLKSFWKQHPFLKSPYDIEIEENWFNLEWEMVPSKGVLFVSSQEKTYKKKEDAFKALDKFILENMIEPIKGEAGEINVVAR